mmetsp:Transcript_24693/g.41176  ORF Transcript_24693/g.41176 Transcript_24693/m.41176 type:complete len:364 (+) Transcript_24693:59-1150(+)
MAESDVSTWSSEEEKEMSDSDVSNWSPDKDEPPNSNRMNPRCQWKSTAGNMNERMMKENLRKKFRCGGVPFIPYDIGDSDGIYVQEHMVNATPTKPVTKVTIQHFKNSEWANTTIQCHACYLKHYDALNGTSRAYWNERGKRDREEKKVTTERKMRKLIDAGSPEARGDTDPMSSTPSLRKTHAELLLKWADTLKHRCKKPDLEKLCVANHMKMSGSKDELVWRLTKGKVHGVPLEACPMCRWSKWDYVYPNDEPETFPTMIICKHMRGPGDSCGFLADLSHKNGAPINKMSSGSGATSTTATGTGTRKFLRPLVDSDSCVLALLGLAAGFDLPDADQNSSTRAAVTGSAGRAIVHEIFAEEE